jgi:hypothetical protein
MGVGSSGPQKRLTPQQKDVKYLGDRMPFGDEELHLIYRAYQTRQQLSDKISFLTDMGVLTAAPPPGATSGSDNVENHVASERLLLLQAVEQKILPPTFGNRLNRTTFLRPQDAASNYNDYWDGAVEGATTNTNGDGGEDEYTRLARLEKFFDGLSNCGRRGAKSTLQVLVSCCKPQPAPSFEESNGDGTASSSSTTTTWINAYELVDLGYRIALASAFLQATARDDEDVGQFFPSPPPQNEADGDETPDAIQALTNSLLALSALRRRQRQREAQRGNPMMMAASNEINPAADATVSAVNVQDVEEWAENVAPLFASSLATFTYDVFFPNRPYPPSRTSFDYPRISDDSTFFRHGSSPLLFSLGCMSSSLSGEVSGKPGLSSHKSEHCKILPLVIAHPLGCLTFSILGLLGVA